jgi:predicted peptidase
LRSAAAWLVLLVMTACARDIETEHEGLRGARFDRPYGAFVYRYFVPPTASAQRELPLVIYLHSNGRQGDDNRKQVDFRVSRWVKNQASYPCFVLAPQMPEGRWVDVDYPRGRYDLATTPATVWMRLTIALIEEKLKHWSVDRRRVYLLGTSLGGYGTWDLLARRPDWFAAAVPIEGGGDPRVAARFADVAVWAFHGAADRSVPVDGSRLMIEALRAAGGTPRYTEYPDVDHDSPARVFAPETGLDAWLFSQARLR